MRLVFLLVLGVLTGCAATDLAETSSVDPLVYDNSAIARAETIVVLIPGALAARDIFAEAEVWANKPGYAIAYYRFPGLDGLALDHDLKINAAAERIATFAGAYPGKKIRVLGYSTGGPIAIVAASKIDGDVRVAAMSSAVERGGGVATGLRSGVDIAVAAARVGSVRLKDVWPSYYRTLLFGRKGLNDPTKSAEIDRLVALKKDDIVLPEDGIGDAHARDLRGWRLPEGLTLAPARLRFFVGGEDPVFSLEQTRDFAEKLGGHKIASYPDQGHLLFLTQPSVFDDILAFFEES